MLFYLAPVSSLGTPLTPSPAQRGLENMPSAKCPVTHGRERGFILTQNPVSARAKGRTEKVEERPENPALLEFAPGCLCGSSTRKESIMVSFEMAGN